MELKTFPDRQAKARGREAWVAADQESSVASAWGGITSAGVATMSVNPNPPLWYPLGRREMGDGLDRGREEGHLQQKRAGRDRGGGCAPGLQQPWLAAVLQVRARDQLAQTVLIRRSVRPDFSPAGSKAGSCASTGQGYRVREA